MTKITNQDALKALNVLKDYLVDRGADSLMKAKKYGQDGVMAGKKIVKNATENLKQKADEAKKNGKKQEDENKSSLFDELTTEDKANDDVESLLKDVFDPDRIYDDEDDEDKDNTTLFALGSRKAYLGGLDLSALKAEWVSNPVSIKWLNDHGYGLVYNAGAEDDGQVSIIKLSTSDNYKFEVLAFDLRAQGMPYMLYYMVDNLSDSEYVSVRNSLARLADEIVNEKGKKIVPEDKAELVASKVVRRRLRELGLWIDDGKDDGKDDDEDDEDY